ncbi:tonB-system energizer ExbB [Sphingobium sp. H39-3-25]|uniref:tonB-system energizer ExbB n=1 Tax=Sphingobium arseniciresistens TaxID=3030834 RepID=UPI0023B973AD|nr:tonB-system energizer ExbB [Sphingobium arseniciresistens]
MRRRSLHRFSPMARWTTRLMSALPVVLASPLLAAPQGTAMVVTRNEGFLSIIGNADPVVKSVMALLVLASITTWALWIIKSQELRRAKDCLKNDIKTMSAATSLEEARTSRYSVTLEMVELATTELRRVGPNPTHRQLAGVEERVAVQLPMVEARAMYRIQWGANILASIGAISPFVGLAGTVWGIMNSFLGIANSHSTSLAVVAPGIAEALIATAIGLAAAIPAVLIYNNLSRSIAGYRRLLNEMAVFAACVLSRESERADEQDSNATPPRPRAATPRLEPVPASAAATEGR